MKDGEKKFCKRNLPKEVKLTIKASQAKKAEGLCVLDLRELTSFTDYFIIMNGNSSRQNIAIYQNIEEQLRKENINPFGVEGLERAEWILIDYGSLVIHIFSKTTREHYALEKLWADAPRLDY
ncbi:MAG TPA: ribosome silencing factor [Candidatus Saccharicenans sp.]|nr:ribosome silencing factor [Candidatus Saccharicenans sp.]HPB59546.1 ribosome silencing factor [Candidatus Saccharicenans sp.]HQO75367.1 ribosome silencing factor [Candidatus Saccharicenans sp.]HUM78616.1 ribosome silencing factor [Candidatus Saccharicenans sp.]